MTSDSTQHSVSIPQAVLEDLSAYSEATDLYLEVTTHSDVLCGPRFARLRLNAEVLETLVGAMNKCAAAGFSYAGLDFEPHSYDSEGLDATVKNWQLRVDAGSFLFFADFGSAICDTPSLPVRELFDALTPSQDADAALPAGFGFYGGALFFTTEDVDDFVSAVCEAIPELVEKEEALEREQTMSSIIDAAAPRAAQVAAPAKPGRAI